MRHSFYDSERYKKKQSLVTKRAWAKGLFNWRYKRVQKICKRNGCGKLFEIQLSDPKKFCSRNCSAIHNNLARGPHTLEWRKKISVSISKSPYHYAARGKILVPRLEKNCLRCNKVFQTPRHQNHKYCGRECAIKDIGSRPTSPKASKGKNGIRSDIHPELNFYSRWEANFARTLNFLNIKWEFQPKSFNLTNQRYTPDFYLPESNTYVEIKNFLSDYSKNRDEGFRKKYPELKLILILKKDYLKLQERFAPLIKTWEYS